MRKPELRTAPDGRLLLRFTVDCGQLNRKLELEVLVLGEPGRELKRKLVIGSPVKISGRLRAVHRRSSDGLSEAFLNVVATKVLSEPSAHEVEAHEVEDGSPAERTGATPKPSRGLGKKVLT